MKKLLCLFRGHKYVIFGTDVDEEWEYPVTWFFFECCECGKTESAIDIDEGIE